MPLQRAPVRFGPFRLHPIQGLSRDGAEIHLTLKAQGVLQTLTERPGEIVTKDELLRAVWPSRPVSDAALSSCIKELRRALRDDARKPRYIGTAHRRGFRFLADCTPEAASAYAAFPAAAPLFGRDAELARLTRLRDRVRDGVSEVVYITGPTGIGKTALVETFFTELAQSDAWSTVAVACAEDFGADSPYQPVIDALSQLSRSPDRADVTSILRHCAPTWLAELWTVQTPTEINAQRQRTGGATAAQMTRELNEALTAITRDRPLALCIDDVQWSDSATLAWIESIARHPVGAAVLLIVISRAAHDARRDDAARCTVIDLPQLDRDAVFHYLRHRRLDELSVDRRGASEADIILHRCGGDPLLLNELTDQLLERSPRAPRSARTADDATASQPLDLPAARAAAIERRLQALSAAQLEMLEAASVAGRDFTSAAVAAACECPLTDVETTLSSLPGLVTRRALVRRPDGTSLTTFRFRHAPCRTALLERLLPSHRAALHGRIGRGLESATGDQAVEVACELAMRFEQASDLMRAVMYLHHAGNVARRRSASAVAVRHYRRALVLLESLPVSAARELSEARLKLALGRELIGIRGPGDEEVRVCYERVETLLPGIEPAAERCAILWGLWVFYLSRGPLAKAKRLADEHLELAQQLGEPALLLESHHAQWSTALLLGEVGSVLTHTRLGMAVCGSRADGSLAMTSGCTLHDVHLDNHHAAVCAGFFSGFADILAGQVENAMRSLDAAIVHARDVDHPFTLALTLTFAGGAAAGGGAAATSRRYAAEGRALATQHGFDVLRAFAAIYEGWALVRLGDTEAGLALLREGLTSHRESGLALLRAFQLALAADAQMCSGLGDEAARSLEEGFAVASRAGDRLALAELHRLRGELAVATSMDRDSRRRAMRDLELAVEIATVQGAWLLVERASTPLKRLRHREQASPVLLKTIR